MSHVESLSCKLTRDEVAARSSELALEIDELGNHQSKSKITKADLGAREKDIQAKITKLAGVVRSGQEVRAVACFEKHLIDKLQVATVREDTGEIVRVRPMTDDEREEATQLRIPGTSAEH